MFQLLTHMFQHIITKHVNLVTLAKICFIHRICNLGFQDSCHAWRRNSFFRNTWSHHMEVCIVVLNVMSIFMWCRISCEKHLQFIIPIWYPQRFQCHNRVLGSIHDGYHTWYSKCRSFRSHSRGFVLSFVFVLEIDNVFDAVGRTTLIFDSCSFCLALYIRYIKELDIAHSKTFKGQNVCTTYFGIFLSDDHQSHF